MSHPVRTALTDQAVVEHSERLSCRGESAWKQGRRYLLGIAGVAGSGKSTLAERLRDLINQEHPGRAVFAPMDGFHLDNNTLREKGWTDRKGAPFTYDAPAYADLLRRYRDATQAGPVPEYCRAVHAPVDSDTPVTRDTRVILAEGQYLLLTQPPWDQLAEVFDETWWLDTPPAAAQRWTIQRHIAVGRTPEQARQKYDHNDGPNSELVRNHRRTPDRIVAW